MDCPVFRSNYISIFIRIFSNWIITFFIWSPIRYEEYNEKNPRTYILIWTIISMAEYIIFVIYTSQRNNVIFLISLFIYAFLFIMIRCIIHLNESGKEKDFIEQMNKDLPVCILYISLFSATNIFICVTCPYNMEYISKIMILLSFLISIISYIYCLKSLKNILKINLRNSCVFINFFSIVVIHVYYFMSVAILQMFDDKIFSIISKVIFFFFSIMLNMLYINQISYKK